MKQDDVAGRVVRDVGDGGPPLVGVYLSKIPVNARRCAFCTAEVGTAVAAR